MQKFRRLIVENDKQASPWSMLSEGQLDAIAAQLDAKDVEEIIDALDDLSLEKNELPEWDGDSQDDVARAQQVLAAILARMTPTHTAAIAARRPTVDPITELYLKMALGLSLA